MLSFAEPETLAQDRKRLKTLSDASASSTPKDKRNVVQIHPPSYYLVYDRLSSSHFSLPCDGFRRTYAAVCDNFRSPYREEIIWPSDLVDAILAVVRKSSTLRKLHLRNCGLKSEFLLGLCSALSANPSMPLEELDLSENCFDESKSVVQFCSCLSSLKTSLEVVKFENCGLSVKSVHALCAALSSHQEKFRVFSLADNILKDDPRLNGGIESLLNLLSCCSSLEVIDLSGTSIALDRIWTCLKKTCSSLHTLKLSRCVFPTAKCKDISLQTSIKDFFASCTALKYIDMAACSIPAETLKFLLLGLVCNQAVNDVYLNLNSIASDRQCFSVLETCAPNLRCVTELALRDNNMEVLASDIMQSISRMPNLQRLNIGGANFTGLKKSQHRTKPHIVLDVVDMITTDNVLQWIDGSSGVGSSRLSLTELNLSDCHLGNALSSILNALGSSPVLKILNVSGNDVGNVGARLLAKALQINDSLESVHIDQNQIGIEGYEELSNALTVNSSLVFMPYPVNDINECFKLNRERTEKVWLQVSIDVSVSLSV
ncbi:unnamed protein product [Soboliphyme baturini]|uniref:Protein NLRC3 n=1 Tax=Soboliphyme baturini TaxID=241478 RepID=A0A183IZ17_9BILA|nr:unnamed protein product [Soboliphyme baturini]